MTQDERGHPHTRGAPKAPVLPNHRINGESPGPIHIRHSTRARISCVLMNLTLSVDAAVVARARKSVAALGLSLNQAVRDYLSDLAGCSPREAAVAEVARLSHQAEGTRADWKFDRDQIHKRP